MSKVSSIVVACVGTALAASLGFASKGSLSPINTSDSTVSYSRVDAGEKALGNVSFSSADGSCYRAGVNEYVPYSPLIDPQTPPSIPEVTDPIPDDHEEQPEEPEEVPEEEQAEESTVTKVDQAQSVLGVIAVVAILGIAGLLAVMFFKGSKKKAAAKK